MKNNHNILREYLEIDSDIQEALAEKQPIVALESTIISHGMPYPQNVEMALSLEDLIRQHHAIPATIGIIKGKIRVGLSSSDIGNLGQMGSKITKASRRDLPYLLSKGLNGATTVSATMIAAKMAGIQVFATGGIGGVHRGAETSFDISADLQELAKTNVAVVCAGIKSILDLGLTLEYLETHGVPVLGYRTKELPAFYTRKSGFQVDYQVDSAKEIARFLKVKWGMNIEGGVVIANPIPEDKELDYDIMMQSIDQALFEANQLGIKGKDSTPFLLAKVKEITKGDSLVSNIELVRNNAILAAEIAGLMNNG